MTETVSSLIPPEHKFGCIACDAHHELASDLAMPSGIRLLTKAPFGIGDLWTKWLGTLKAEILQEARFLILAVAPSSDPGVLDGENKELQRRANTYFFALRLLGAYSYEGVTLSGAHHDGEVRVRQIATLQDQRQTGTLPTPITEALAHRADLIATGIREVFDAEGQFGRVRRGFAAWHRGACEDLLSFRLHQFVRSLDAIVKTGPGEGRAAFADRGQTLIGASSVNRDLLVEMYALRSGSEHLHEWDYGLDAVPHDEREARGALRAFQAEVLSGEAFARIFGDTKLRSHFSSDVSIDDFWKLSSGARAQLWGTPIDLDDIVQDRRH